jgi:tRNA-Thr(GGU) m(6)t(6)A37 methyltransferase TsaA
MDYAVRAIGHVASPLAARADAPRQGDEGAPDADVILDESVVAALHGVEVGRDYLLVTWLREADRSVLSVHPRDDLSRPVQGVFNTRSSDRPNPIGLHRVRVLAVDGNRLRVSSLEAIDGTPVLDIKPVIGGADER